MLDTDILCSMQHEPQKGHVCETHVDKAQDTSQPELKEETPCDGLTVHLKKMINRLEEAKETCSTEVVDEKNRLTRWLI